MSKEINTQTDSHLSFKLGSEVFAVNVSKVLEILELRQITRVPKCPDYMRGVINLRGSVLPVIDTRIKFGMSSVNDTINTCIMVLQVLVEDEVLVVGALVDAVLEVLEIDEDQIQAPPSMGLRYKSDLIKGMVKWEEQFIMILHMDMVFSDDDLLLAQVTSEVK